MKAESVRYAHVTHLSNQVLTYIIELLFRTQTSLRNVFTVFKKNLLIKKGFVTRILDQDKALIRTNNNFRQKLDVRFS